MPELDGLEVTTELQRALPACHVVILTGQGRPPHLQKASRSSSASWVASSVGSSPVDCSTVQRTPDEVRIPRAAASWSARSTVRYPCTASRTSVNAAAASCCASVASRLARSAFVGASRAASSAFSAMVASRCPSRSWTSLANLSRSSVTASRACAARPARACTSSPHSQTGRLLIAATLTARLPVTTRYVHTGPPVTSAMPTATTSRAADATAAAERRSSTGVKPAAAPPAQAQVTHSAFATGASSGTDSTLAAPSAVSSSRRVRSGSHGVAAAYRAQASVPANRHSPSVPSTSQSTRCSVVSARAGISMLADQATPSDAKVAYLARRSRGSASSCSAAVVTRRCYAGWSPG